jgi:hypothetical protein
MKKKIFIVFLALLFAVTPLLSTAPVSAADTEVCGTNNVTYESADAAETAGFDVSYSFACTDPTNEEGLYEEMTEINFAGMLIEVGSTDIPTTLRIRDNSNGEDYTIEVSNDTVLGQRKDQTTLLSDWIPGDQIRVIGKKNENTENIEASVLVNLSIKTTSNLGVNGWITNIDKENKTITYQWANVEHTFTYTDDTRLVVGGINPASVDDLEINDRIRGRLLLRQCVTEPCYNEAKIIIVLRRGENLFMKIRTFRPNATLVRLDSTIVPTTIQVRIEKTAGLTGGDVNNLIGDEGALVTVNVTGDTKIVRKYFGKTTLDEFSIDDKLQIVGRVNDDGTIDANLLKNVSVWKTSTQGHAGVVTEINSDEGYLTMNWAPYRHITKKQLREKLGEENTAVFAQSARAEATSLNPTETQKLKNKMQSRIGEIVGKFKREIKEKMIVINRIRTGNVKIKDLITRLTPKKIKVEVNTDTKIIIGGNTTATLSDIKVGDKIRTRGTRSKTNDLITADTIVVVPSIPEIDEALETGIDEVNEVVSIINVDDEEDENDTEEIIDNEDGDDENEDEDESSEE